MQVAQFVSLFWYCWNSEDWQSAGKKLQVLGSGVAAINYVAQVLTPITLCCHSLGEMTLMSLSHECNCRMSFTLHSNPRKKNGLTCLIKLWSGSHKTLANALWKHQNQGLNCVMHSLNTCYVWGKTNKWDINVILRDIFIYINVGLVVSRQNYYKKTMNQSGALVRLESKGAQEVRCCQVLV